MQAVAFDARQSDVIQYGNKTGPLDTDGHSIGGNDARDPGGAATPATFEYRNDGTANAILTPNGVYAPESASERWRSRRTNATRYARWTWRAFWRVIRG